ncbi:MAG: DUF1223 domain-containing protein [Tateyamaria sp.]|uniref:DUF1223 domain-containing protein n=1 Tax=Tateyamaria sp. TaxID=1929288 RepID=UPI00329DE8E6
MKLISSILLAGITAFSSPVAAQSPVVVELFTSQGCSSCPPADKLLHELAKRDDVIALALHVDYWDYIGWKDEFAHPAYSDRQRNYAREGRRRSVYTPQMIINGVTSVVGARPMELSKAIADASAAPSVVDMNVAMNDGVLNVSATTSHRGRPLLVHVVRYQPERESRITRGENAGHTINYAHVTEDWKILREWDGAAALSVDMPVEGDHPLVVMIQEGRSGPILAAAEIK